MNIADVCASVDKYELMETQLQLDREYIASTDVIYTDGQVQYDISGDGYIHIKSVIDANFIMFINIEHQVYLCAYKYIPDSKCKQIKQKLLLLKNTIGKSCNTDNNINNHISDDVIDINSFKCTECDCEDELLFYRGITNFETLKTRCSNCGTEYVFVPSRYYKLASKKTIYFKSDKSSRQIKIAESTNHNEL